MKSLAKFLLTFSGLVVLSLPALPGETIGWRTDGTGSYPKAQPPVEWSTTKNVVWKTPMPGPSNSIPVLLGDRIYISSEPCMLLCLDRKDGRILWQKNSSLEELELASTVRDKLRLEQAEAARLDKQISALGREAESLRRKLKENPAAKGELDKQLSELQGKTDALKEQKQKLTLAAHYTERNKQPTAGYSSPTPATNGKEVFVAFGNGLMACFDLDGKRNWLKLIEQSTAPFAHANSPVLVGDKVLIHFADLVALRTTDGSECWRVKRAPTHGTSLVARMGETDAVVTPHGLIVRAQDGAILAEGLGVCGANSPILQDGTVYFIRGGATAIRLPASLTESMKIAPLWKGKVKGGGYWFPSPVLHEGLLYAIDDRGVFSVLEAKTGKPVYEERIELGGTCYPSLSLAGNRVYVSSDNGATVVVQAGREHKVLARNQLEPFRSSLVFDGKRMYVRTHKTFYCIGD